MCLSVRKQPQGGVAALRSELVARISATQAMVDLLTEVMLNRDQFSKDLEFSTRHRIIFDSGEKSFSTLVWEEARRFM